MTDFHVAQVTLVRAGDLLARGVIDSTEEFVRLGIAVGLAEDARDRVDTPVAFHTIEDLDPGRVFSVVAASRSGTLDDEEKLASDLEQYAEAGMRKLLKETAGETLDWYGLARRYRTGA